MRLKQILSVCLFTAAVGVPLQAQTPALTKDIQIPAGNGWVDTGVDLRAGDTVRISAKGEITVGQGKTTGPEGAKRGFADLIKSYPVTTGNGGALIGRYGNGAAAAPFLIGSSRQLEVPRAGRLFLAANASNLDKYSGSYDAKIEVLTRGPEATAVPANLKLPEVTLAMVDSVARRVNDADGTLGDNTNFMIVGSEKRIVEALTNAGWITVDREAKNAVLTGLMATLSKQAYVKIPMSQLMLFGRVQDYGWAHAEPVMVVARRHHFRIWKAPFQAEGQEVWVGAGTHDIGFDKDQRNGKLTHKIDPDVDLEREFIGESLNETGMVARRSYIMPSMPNKLAKTAHGEEFHSDGRVLVIHLVPEVVNTASAEAAFSNLFCSVLEKKNPDTGTWPPCDQLLDRVSATRVDLAPIASKYRVLIVPGFFSACASSTAPAFGNGETLRKQGVTVETWVPPNDSSEANGAKIANYLAAQMLGSDQRKYIVIGYSKGAPDIQTALALNPKAKDYVAAFVSVAGAIGGSAIADALPAQADGWMQRFKMGKCEGDVATAFNSLKREVRQAFLRTYPNPVVPSYSLPAVSTLAKTSKGMQQSWQMMSALATRQDSQLAWEDAQIPGGKYLGAALADHLAVALPFDQSTDNAIKAMADQGRYPRAALLETIVRFVNQDLDGK